MSITIMSSSLASDTGLDAFVILAEITVRRWVNALYLCAGGAGMRTGAHRAPRAVAVSRTRPVCFNSPVKSRAGASLLHNTLV